MKKLNFDEIKSVTSGTVYIKEENNGISFHRFTKEQEELYIFQKPTLSDKAFSGSGIKLMFVTNSEKLFLSVSVKAASSRSYFSIPIYSNDIYLDEINNYSDTEINSENLKSEFLLGEFSKEFYLGKGEKKIVVYMPWSASVLIKELMLDEGAEITPIKFDKKILMYGDSITQGYDALNPKNRYACAVSEAFNAEEINKAVGGEIFFPRLAELKDDFVPDYITVAYGTNDWFKSNRETFEKNSEEFLINLRKNYPDIKIFLFSPLWRKESEGKNEWNFRDVAEHLKSISQKIENVVFIDGFHFVPHKTEYFSDLRLHPNDKGFSSYFEKLHAELKKYII